MKTRSELVEFLTSYIEKAPNKVLSWLLSFVLNLRFEQFPKTREGKLETRSGMVEFLSSYIERAPYKVLSWLYAFVTALKFEQPSKVL